MIQTIKMNLDDKENLTSIAKALSADTRVEMLKLLRTRDLNVNEMADILRIPTSSAAVHVKVLEEAGLIKTKLLPGIRGSMKMCHNIMDHIYIELNTTENLEQDIVSISMPVGSYIDYKVEKTCGMAGAKGPICEEDEPRCFYSPDRFDAKLLWFGNGYVEYRFPNNSLKNKKEKRLEVSAELCSEDHEYNLDYPSDITLWVNGIEVSTWTSPGDFGGRRGNFNPDWWPDKNTQFGLLKTWAITEEGTFLDNEKTGERKLSDFHLYDGEYISVRIGIKEDALHIGGINLFGDGFGDYNRNIVMKLFF